MSNLVLYRKYRPQLFEEIAGQEHIVKTLTNAIKANRIGHAYLFSGPRGTGKTTIARLLAKAVNCLDLPPNKAEPCGKCLSCKGIAESRIIDLIEIDAASNRGINEIRELREGIKFSPVSSKYKVFIIDEVHMLTTEAFNALLKTLEEPPSHAIFILATTEIHKVPATILSRCQRFDFRKLRVNELSERLKFICVKEKINIDQNALEFIAVNSDGCARDSESMLQQIISMSGQKISLKDVQDILGITDIKAVSDLADFMADKNISGALLHVNNLCDQGYDMFQFAKSCVNYLRKIMIVKTDPNLAGLIASELTKEQLDIILKQAKKFSSVPQILDLFLKAQQEIKNSPLPQLSLEMAIIESGQSNENNVK